METLHLKVTRPEHFTDDQWDEFLTDLYNVLDDNSVGYVEGEAI